MQLYRYRHITSSVQSALGMPTDDADAASVNRSMDTSIDSSQATLSVSVPTHSAPTVVSILLSSYEHNQSCLRYLELDVCDRSGKWYAVIS